jgi:hypothetical protein
VLNKVIAGGVLLLALLAAGWWVKDLHADNVRLTEANAQMASDIEALNIQRDNDAKVAKQHLAAIATLREKKRQADAKLSTALAQNPDWASQRVPDDVAAALGVREQTSP